MKNFSKYLILAAILATFSDCSNQTVRMDETESIHGELDSIFQIVQIKLKSDSMSYKTFGTLYSKYLTDIDLNDTSLGNFYDLYLSLYNEGNPFVRLINENKLINLFDSIASKKNHQELLWSNYCKIIIDRSNYRTDEDIGGENSQDYFFKEYISKNIVLPNSH